MVRVRNLIKWSTPIDDTMEEWTSPRKINNDLLMMQENWKNVYIWCNVEDNKKKELRLGPTLKKKKCFKTTNGLHGYITIQLQIQPWWLIGHITDFGAIKRFRIKISAKIPQKIFNNQK